MTRYLVGLLVGSVGTLLGVYAFAALLPATREEKPRDPLPRSIDHRELTGGWNAADIQWSYTIT